MYAHEITQIVQTRKLNDQHIYLTMVSKLVSLHSVGFEIFKNVSGSIGNLVKYIITVFNAL